MALAQNKKIQKTLQDPYDIRKGPIHIKKGNFVKKLILATFCRKSFSEGNIKLFSKTGSIDKDRSPTGIEYLMLAR